ncbi:hypothetical protein MWN33_15440 [Starkeya koreensis]|uniref:Uncharacterized protein n=1 Tax=Ancylobacter koreensis TaxID=266121 RepID=A0ABT0DQ66_9HYPH|nr:hypothetical protein [Ancylobacter koreensis]MCK0209427.1 hypothetical protein [Ancylobacter koreensis]
MMPKLALPRASFARLATVRLPTLSLRMQYAGGVVVSAAIIAGFVGAAYRVLPHAPSPARMMYFREPQPATIGYTGTVPVFVMKPDHSVVRHGTAEMGAGGLIRVDLFPSTINEYANATEALLADPSLGILWAAATDTSQAELRHRITLVQDMAAQTIERVITSDVFTDDYRPVLRAMLTDAISSAWRDPRTQKAVEGLLANAEPALRRTLNGEVRQILVSRLSAAIWQMLRANWANAFGVPFGYELDYEPAIRAMTETLADPRLQHVLLGFGRAQLETREARQLAERLVIGSFDALMRDRRVPATVSQMFWDVRLRAMLRPFTNSLFALAGALPQHLGGLGSESTLNPLAAHVFKAFAVASRTPLILLVTPADLDRLQTMESDTAVTLQRVAAGAASGAGEAAP